MDEALIWAEVTRKPMQTTFLVGGNEVSTYVVGYQGVKTDNTGQPVDLFRFVRLDEGGADKLVSRIIVATFRAESPQLDRLVLMILDNEDSSVPRHQFHFVNDHLFSVMQIGQPQVLFGSPQLDEKQFLAIGLGHSDGHLVLKVEAGHLHDQESNCHWYKNIGGNLVKAQNVRVNGSELEFYDISQRGIVYCFPPINLPRAIENIANFEPASHSD